MATETSKTGKKKKKVTRKRKKATKKATATTDANADEAATETDVAESADETVAAEAEGKPAAKTTRARKTPARKKTTKKKKATKTRKKRTSRSQKADDESVDAETTSVGEDEAVLIPFPGAEQSEEAAPATSRRAKAAAVSRQQVAAETPTGTDEIDWPVFDWPGDNDNDDDNDIPGPDSGLAATAEMSVEAPVETPKSTDDDDDDTPLTGRKKRPRKRRSSRSKDRQENAPEDVAEAPVAETPTVDDAENDSDFGFGLPDDEDDSVAVADREDVDGGAESRDGDADGNVAEKPREGRSSRGRGKRSSRGRRRRGDQRREGGEEDAGRGERESKVDRQSKEDDKADKDDSEDDSKESKDRGRKDGRGSRRGGRSERGAGRRSRSRSRRDEITTDPEDIIEVDGGEASPKKADRTMLINAAAGDECRIAVVSNGRLEELFIERASSQSHVGNIYKGRVTNVEPSIQAAFVDFGLVKNGFLHISDVQPQYFPNYSGEPEEVGRKIPRRNRPPIQDCFQRGQEVIVQVIKEGVGTKGPTLTTYLSIPGRFLVMMPGMNRHGVSRKIDDEDARREMKGILSEMSFPTGIGFILRTAGMGQNKRELQRDLNYLTRLWKTVIARVKKLNAPAELYQESDLVTRTIRDVFTSDFRRVVVDDAEAARRANEFLRIAMPRAKVALELYSDREPLFHRFGIEHEIDNISKREVPLPSGGSLVIESTEALVAIDVNSGKFRTPEDAEEMAHKLNMEAAEEIARQLRLRDLGGLIICDFIDMRLDRHKREVERELRDALKSHKERARILRMSAFGLIELTRQRRGPGMKRNTYFECRHCRGSGLLKMPESVVLDVMRAVQLASHHERIRVITVTASAGVAYQILNRKRAALAAMEEETGKEIIVRGDANFTDDQVEYHCEDSRGQLVTLNMRGS